MLGKPIQLPEARDLYQGGLKIVSCYQFGNQDTADWQGGQAAGSSTPSGAGNYTSRRVGRTGPRSTRRSTTTPPLSSTNSWWPPICAGGRRCWATNAWGSTPTPRPSTGPCRTVWVPTSGSTTGVHRRVHPPRSALASGGDRRAKRGWRRRGSQPRAEATLRAMGLTLPIGKFFQLTPSAIDRSLVDNQGAGVDFSGDVVGSACAPKFNITIR